MLRSKLTACLLVGLIATVAVGAPLAAAKTAKYRHGPLAQTPLGRLIVGNFGRLLVLRSELNVTDQQRDQVRQILESHKAEIGRYAQAIWQKRNALRDAVTADAPDEAAIRKAAGALGEVIGDASVAAVKLRAEVAPVFTEEQKERIEECRTECQGAVEAFFLQLTQAE